jgi:hypothetical protein
MPAKREIERPPSKISRGYSWVGDRGLSYSLGAKTPPDLQESFAMGPPDPAAARAGRDAGGEGVLLSPTCGHRTRRDFRAAFESCYREMEDIAAR